jgi:hypothetical protein
MRFIKRSTRKAPRVSLVLLDWSVRESFHLLNYLSEQTVSRDDFEVIIIEYYSRISPALKAVEDQVDTWLILDVPQNCYYHKHLMYNAGIVAARGDIIMIGDSDAMVKPTFIETIIKQFDSDPKVVYHIDQFRNLRRDFYPFNYPSFDDVLGVGCINNVGGKTAGVLNTEDPIHSRNYGACMCARREDMITIGGADMHIDYLGHICGPYDMTFRLINYGRRELWDQSEFTYHTWHPGQAGADNYLGPHDGRHMSTTSLEALTSGRITPLDENEAIRLLRTGATHDVDVALAKVIPEGIERSWDLKYVEANASHLRFANYRVPLGVFKGFRIVSEFGRILAYPLAERRSELEGGTERPIFEGSTEDEVKAMIVKATSPAVSVLYWLTPLYVLPFSLARMIIGLSQRLPISASRRAKAIVGLLGAPFAFVILALFVPAPLIGKIRRMKRDNVTAVESLDNMAATLHNLAKWASASEPSELPIVLTNERRAFYFLKILQFLKLVPPMIVRRAASIDSVQSVLTELEGRRWSGQLLVPSDLFNRFHAVIAPARAAERLIVM